MAISLDDARAFESMPSLMQRVYGKPRHSARRVLGRRLYLGASFIALSVWMHPLGR
jgi:hypothetical protein